MNIVKFICHPSRLYITIWFLLNISLTLLNKGVMVFSHFRYPITLSFIHMSTSTIMSFISTTFFHYDPSTEKQKEIQAQPNFEKTVMTRILKLSLLFSLNIIFGNYALRLCSVAFVQIVRAIIPLITMILSVIFLHSKFSKSLYLSCSVVCIGVALSCFGEINLTFYGIFITICACIFSSSKSISIKLSLSGNFELSSFDLLQRMTPISSIEMFFLILAFGENQQMVESETYQSSFYGILGCIISGIIAFFLNLTNFLATFYTTPLTVTIAGCVKQVVTIALSVIIFDKSITMTNIIGIIITTLGSSWYAFLKINKKPKKPNNIPLAISQAENTKTEIQNEQTA